MEDHHTLLLADEHAAHRQRLADRLAADGYTVTQAATRAAAAQQLLTTRADVLIVGDLRPLTAPAAFVAALRAGELAPAVRDVPVIVLTTDPRELALLQCFAAGADDFQPRWVAYPELRARIASVLSRAHARARPPLRWAFGPLTIDIDARQASWRDRRLPLSNMEFALLAQLASDPTRVHHKDDLLRDVWGFQAPAKTRTVEAHAYRLRRKLIAVGADGWVVTRHGLGYQLVDTASAAAVGPPTAV